MMKDPNRRSLFPLFILVVLCVGLFVSYAAGYWPHPASAAVLDSPTVTIPALPAALNSVPGAADAWSTHRKLQSDIRRLTQGDVLRTLQSDIDQDNGILVRVQQLAQKHGYTFDDKTGGFVELPPAPPAAATPAK